MIVGSKDISTARYDTKGSRSRAKHAFTSMQNSGNAIGQSYSKVIDSEEISKGVGSSLRRSVDVTAKKDSKPLAPLHGQSSLRSSLDNSTYGLTNQLNDYEFDVRVKDPFTSTAVPSAKQSPINRISINEHSSRLFDVSLSHKEISRAQREEVKNVINECGYFAHEHHDDLKSEMNERFRDYNDYLDRFDNHIGVLTLKPKAHIDDVFEEDIEARFAYRTKVDSRTNKFKVRVVEALRELRQQSESKKAKPKR